MGFFHIPRRNEKQRLCKILGGKKGVLWEKWKMVNGLFRNTLFWPLAYKQLHLQTLLKLLVKMYMPKAYKRQFTVFLHWHWRLSWDSSYLRRSAVEQHGWFSTKDKFSCFPVVSDMTLLIKIIMTIIAEYKWYLKVFWICINFKHNCPGNSQRFQWTEDFCHLAK